MLNIFRVTLLNLDLLLQVRYAPAVLQRHEDKKPPHGTLSDVGASNEITPASPPNIERLPECWKWRPATNDDLPLGKNRTYGKTDEKAQEVKPSMADGGPTAECDLPLGGAGT